jgi:hypothetical protein
MCRWLKQDLPHRIERSFEVPVRHIAAKTTLEPANR